jgi:hypothetical protein
MRMELSLRPDYASIVPWVESISDGVIATAGPDAFRLSTVLPLEIGRAPSRHPRPVATPRRNDAE